MCIYIYMSDPSLADEDDNNEHDGDDDIDDSYVGIWYD